MIWDGGNVTQTLKCLVAICHLATYLQYGEVETLGMKHIPDYTIHVP